MNILYWSVHSILDKISGKTHRGMKKLKVEKIKKACLCGKKFLLAPGRIRKGRGKYCSRMCLHKYRDNSKFLSFIRNRGKKNQNWKGNSAGYKALHLRVTNNRGKATICEECKSTYFVEWANLTGKYYDVMDYKSLCRKCHNKFDSTGIRVIKIKRKKYNLSDIARKGWETRRLLSIEGGLRK